MGCNEHKPSEHYEGHLAYVNKFVNEKKINERIIFFLTWKKRSQHTQTQLLHGIEYDLDNNDEYLFQ